MVTRCRHLYCRQCTSWTPIPTVRKCWLNKKVSGNCQLDVRISQLCVDCEIVWPLSKSMPMIRYEGWDNHFKRCRQMVLLLQLHWVEFETTHYKPFQACFLLHFCFLRASFNGLPRVVCCMELRPSYMHVTTKHSRMILLDSIHNPLNALTQCP